MTVEHGADWQAPERDVRFGDVFEAEWLLDLFVRDDTQLIGGGRLAGNLVIKLGNWMSTKLPAEPIELYSPAFALKSSDRYALGHASYLPDQESHHAIVVSDSCLLATALVQGRSNRSVSGRLLFAPVRGVTAETHDKLEDTVDFGRMALPVSAELPDYPVAELRQCFMVEAGHVKAHVDQRVAACNEELALELEEHWTAFAARRGRLTYERNLLKLAFLLAGGSQPDEAHIGITDQVADVLDLAWELEGSALEAVSDSEEAVRQDHEPAETHKAARLDDLVPQLRQLAELAKTAADTLQAARG